MSFVVATVSPFRDREIASFLRTFAALAASGFRRYFTYRQATVAGLFANTVFGFLRCYVLRAVASGAGGSVVGGRIRRVVHDGTIEALHARYGSRRLVVVDVDEPVADPPAVPGAALHSVGADRRRLVYDVATAGVAQVVTRVAALGSLRDIAIVEPDIEDVVARLYAADPAPRQGWSINSTASVPGSSAS